MQRGVSTDYWYFQDDLSSTVAVADDDGNVLERVEYGDYGQPQVTDYATGAKIAAPSSIGNPYLFTGRRYDAESGWYYYRTRYMEPGAGRFTTRDSIGIWGDAGNMGNGYAYVGNRPTNVWDPMGKEGCCERMPGEYGGAIPLVEGGTEKERELVTKALRRACGKAQSDMVEYIHQKMIEYDEKNEVPHLRRSHAICLNKCLQKRCKKGVVVIEERGGKCDDKWGYFMNYPFGLNGNEIHICPGVIQQSDISDPDSGPWDSLDHTIMHEFTHSCGYHYSPDETHEFPDAIGDFFGTHPETASGDK